MPDIPDPNGAFGSVDQRQGVQRDRSRAPERAISSAHRYAAFAATGAFAADAKKEEAKPAAAASAASGAAKKEEKKVAKEEKAAAKKEEAKK